VQVVSAAQTVSLVPEDLNATTSDLSPALDAARYLLLDETGQVPEDEQVAAKEKEVKENKNAVASLIATCRVPTLCSNQTEETPPSPDQAACNQVAKIRGCNPQWIAEREALIAQKAHATQHTCGRYAVWLLSS